MPWPIFAVSLALLTRRLRGVILSGAYGLLVTWNFLVSFSDDRLSLVTSLAVHRFQTNPFCFEINTGLDAASSLRHWFTFHHHRFSRRFSASQSSRLQPPAYRVSTHCKRSSTVRDPSFFTLALSLLPRRFLS
ncbi:hypothetical protein C8J56DRAFT_966050 [Mycena floridula]|nr:hypothetical protein C8J56DRAFT_966050 [Mycena floridula]